MPRVQGTNSRVTSPGSFTERPKLNNYPEVSEAAPFQHPVQTLPLDPPLALLFDPPSEYPQTEYVVGIVTGPIP